MVFFCDWWRGERDREREERAHCWEDRHPIGNATGGRFLICGVYACVCGFSNERSLLSFRSALECGVWSVWWSVCGRGGVAVVCSSCISGSQFGR